MLHLGRELLLKTLGPDCRIRLLGLSVSNLEWENNNRSIQQMLEFYLDQEGFELEE